MTPLDRKAVPCKRLKPSFKSNITIQYQCAIGRPRALRRLHWALAEIRYGIDRLDDATDDRRPVGMRIRDLF
jgi:hypothetical protein